MKGYIERAAVEEMLENAQLISDGEYCGYCTEDVNLGSIPAADVAEVRHGRWIVSEMNFGYCDIIQKEYTAKKYTCSECGYETGDQAKKFACCPICMARMDEEDEHEAD